MATGPERTAGLNPAELLGRVPGFDPEGACFTPLASRGTAVWRVDSDAGSFVLRYQPGNATVGNDDAWRNAAVADGLAPELIGRSADGDLSLERFVPGTAWTTVELREPHNLEMLGNRLKRLQLLPAPGREFSAPGYAAEYRADGATDSAANDRLLELIPEADAIGGPLVLAHGDLTAGNCVAGHGVLTFIDWEFTRAASCWLDPATVVFHHCLDAEQTDRFLCAWLGRKPGSQDWEALRLWGALYDSLFMLWASCPNVALDDPARRALEAAKQRAAGRFTA